MNPVLLTSGYCPHGQLVTQSSGMNRDWGCRLCALEKGILNAMLCGNGQGIIGLIKRGDVERLLQLRDESSGITPLLACVVHADERAFGQLLGMGASLDARDNNGNGLMHIAAKHNRLQFMINILFKQLDLSLEERNPLNDASPLRVAIENESKDVAAFL